jgi:hypothetical protein
MYRQNHQGISKIEISSIDPPSDEIDRENHHELSKIIFYSLDWPLVEIDR